MSRGSSAIEHMGVQMGACALTSVLLNSHPVGVVGSAGFGAAWYLSEWGLRASGNAIIQNLISSSHWDPNNHVETTAKLLVVAASFFGGCALAWGVFAAAGVKFTLSQVALFYMVSQTTFTMKNIFDHAMNRGEAIDA